MPGNVSAAAPSTVMPLSLSKAFSHSREYPLIENEYKNGESQRSLNAASSRKTWQLTKRLTPSQLATLRTFYFALNGPQQPFYFYDPFETSPKFSYDGTGVVTTGRYTVRFDTPWQQQAFPARLETPVVLIELA